MKVEILDEYMYLQEDANDHQIRIVIEFQGKLNIDKFKLVIKESFKYVPILASKLVKKGNHLDWEEVNLGDLSQQYIEIMKSDSNFSQLKDNLTKQADQFHGPQLKAIVLQSDMKDMLILIINHMVMDGSGCKKYLSLLSKLYYDIEINRNEMPSERNIYKILNQVSGKKNHRKVKKRTISSLDLLKNGNLNNTVMLFTHQINDTDGMKIQNYCKAKKITINDYMITVFMLALIDAGYFQINAPINIDMMIDTRRYDQNNLLSPFINASSMEKVIIWCNNNDEEQLLMNIHEKLEKVKRNMPGYKGLQDLKLIRSILPKWVYVKILKNIIKTPGISTTNIGRIDGKDIYFGNTKINNAYFVTALKKNNSIQFSFSSFENTINITTFGCYSPEKIESINDIYRYIDKHQNFCQHYI